MAYSKHAAAEKAFAIITAALSSGSIKIVGAHAAPEQAERHAAGDAAYLSKLLTDLSASIEKMGD